MVKNEPKLHFLIEKQLKRSKFNINDVPPEKRGECLDFISRISRSYKDHEQEIYLIERSMEISSREMMKLNEMLEYAQEIAHLGYWFYDAEEDKFTWSRETYNLTGIDPSEGTPNLEEVYTLVHEDDRPKLRKLIELAFSEGKDYEIELRFKNKKTNTYNWHYAKGHPHSENVDSPNKIRYLSGIAIDITNRKLYEEKLNKMHQQLLAISRQAGMSEVATSILHNIGNILNSANISISLILEMVENSKMDKIVEVSGLIKEHLEKNDHYFEYDEKGKMIPTYLLKLSQHMLTEYNKISNEITNVHTHLWHIKDIVSLQNAISGVSGIKEKINIHELVDLAIKIGLSDSKNNIKLIKKYYYNSFVNTEKSKLLQIIINLIQNARDSVLQQTNGSKEISITIKENESKEFVQIIISDNGLGISKENITKIFSLGFTTKVNGHGFGLHSSAIAAKELGGNLRLNHSEIGKKSGATFIVEIPLLE